MKQLIVNADDLGANESRNAGIFDAIEAGLVTSCSILANGTARDDAVRRIRSFNRKNVSWGIHINLSEGAPLSSGLRHITGPDGAFLGKASSQSLLRRQGDAEVEQEVRKELAAQIVFLLEAGVPLGHMDGHQHVHVFPAVVRIAAEAAKTSGISWFRIPEEPLDDFSAAWSSSAVQEEAEIFSGYAQAARPLAAEMGISATDHFRGLYMKGRLPAALWADFLEAMPKGLTELMVHPGRAADSAAFGPFSGFSTSDRDSELAALVDGRFQLALLKTGVELAPFPDVFRMHNKLQQRLIQTDRGNV